MPLIILHGLFGSSKNWQNVGKELSKNFHVYLLDHRNHGDSFHSETHTLFDMAEDLRRWLEAYKIDSPILMGHSMGGMAAMVYSLLYPQKVHRLIVIDIAPKSYQTSYEKEFAALELDFSKMNSREEIDSQMANILPNKPLRQFLQMNLVKQDEGYKLKLNVKTLKQERKRTFTNFPIGKTYQGSTLFLRAGRSDYIKDEDESTIMKYFPNARIEFIPDGDHWLHHSAPEVFLRYVKDFL